MCVVLIVLIYMRCRWVCVFIVCLFGLMIWFVRLLSGCGLVGLYCLLCVCWLAIAFDLIVLVIALGLGCLGVWGFVVDVWVFVGFCDFGIVVLV